MSPDQVFRMAFTSGTTGDPKCVLHSFNTTLCTVKLLNDDMAVSDRDVLLIYLPGGLNWGYICLMQTIMAGGPARVPGGSPPRAGPGGGERGKISVNAPPPRPSAAPRHQPPPRQIRVLS